MITSWMLTRVGNDVSWINSLLFKRKKKVEMGFEDSETNRSSTNLIIFPLHTHINSKCKAGSGCIRKKIIVWTKQTSERRSAQSCHYNSFPCTARDKQFLAKTEQQPGTGQQRLRGRWGGGREGRAQWPQMPPWLLTAAHFYQQTALESQHCTAKTSLHSSSHWPIRKNATVWTRVAPMLKLWTFLFTFLVFFFENIDCLTIVY